MKKIISFLISLVLTFSVFNVLVLAGNQGEPELLDLPEYEYEDVADEQNSKVIYKTIRPTNIPSEGIKSTYGTSVYISNSVIADPTLSVSFSLSFGFFSVSFTPEIGSGFMKYNAGGVNVNIPGGNGRYIVEINSKIKVTPIITRRKLVGSHTWHNYSVRNVYSEVLHADYSVIRVS